MIPLKLETLLKGRVVEQDRVEYKRGWNPADVIRTICAYANDFTNINGGYIVIGVEEKYGRPILPPTGVAEDQLDRIQNELLQYCNLIEPRYIPQAEVVCHDGKYVLYLWCAAGDNGPYAAPKDVYSKDKGHRHREYWIKPASVVMIAKGDELSELFEKFNSVPFDDRINRRAKITDIRRGFLEDFLIESDSALSDEINYKSLEDILVALEAANVTDAGIDIRNIGVLMFSEHPEKFIPETKIELIRFNSPDAEGSDDFTEKTFYGPLHKQIKDALSYINAIQIEEKVIKRPGRAEADRFFNYPYSALEEVLVNAVFHKSYLVHEPVEIRIYVDCIKIINYPGPEKWIDMDDFKAGRAVARRYRNRRIGEFLKEIDLAEKKSTGVIKILRSLEANGSPPPEFETDEGRNYFIATIRQHVGFRTAEHMDEHVNEHVNEHVYRRLKESEAAYDSLNRQDKIVAALNENRNFTIRRLSEKTGVSQATVRREMEKLKTGGVIKRVGSDKTGYWEVTE